MTTTTTCPAWCTTDSPDYPCRGEHYGRTDYVSATAGRHPLTDDRLGGARYPMVGAALVFSPLDGDEVPFLTLHLTGAGLDQNVDLRLREAKQLVEEMQQRIAVLEGAAEA